MTMECIVFYCFSPTAAIQVTFSPTDHSASEEAGNVVLTLLANQPALFDYTVQVDIVDGAAVGQLLRWSLNTHYGQTSSLEYCTQR